MKLNLAIFISGRGSNMLSILEACKDATFPARIELIVSNQPDAAGLEIARKEGISTEVIDHTAYTSREDFEEEISNRLKNYNIDLIVLAGFMRILTAGFVDQWQDKMINIHPSLLPDYKGLNTHKRAIDDGKNEAGCTVHYVTPDLDSGTIITQKRVPILPGDTPETLAERVLIEEHRIYPKAIKIVADHLGKNDE